MTVCLLSTVSTPPFLDLFDVGHSPDSGGSGWGAFFGVVVGGVITFIVLTLIERQKQMVEQRGRLLRLAAELKAAARYTALIVSAVREQRGRPKSEELTRPRWNKLFIISDSLARLQALSERFDHGADWVPLVEEDTLDRILTASASVAALCAQVSDLDHTLSVMEEETKGLKDVRSTMTRVVRRAHDSDEIDKVLEESLEPVSKNLEIAEKSVRAAAEARDSWFFRFPT